MVTVTHEGKQGLKNAPERRIYVGLWNNVRRVAKGSTEGRQMVSTGREESTLIHVRMV